MKKFSLFFTFFICFLCVVPVKAEEKKQGFYFGWENDLHEFSEELNENDLIGVILGDNLAFGDNTVIISTVRKTVETEETTEFVSSIKLEIRDKNGKKIVDSVIEDSVFFGGIVKDDYLYMCVYKNIKDATANSDDNLYLLKINNKLEIVKSLKFDESFSPDNGVLMILTGISGYNMFTVDDEKIYVLDYENGILSTSFDLDSWNIEFEFPEINTEDSSEIPEEVKENVLSELSKYFPDLSKEINSILELTKKTGNLEDVPDFDFDIDITTHIMKI